jgi:hypothetical protein
MNPCPSSTPILASSSPPHSSPPSSPLLPLAQLVGVKRRRELPVTTTTPTSPSPSTATSTTTTTSALYDYDYDSDATTIGLEERDKLLDQLWQRDRERAVQSGRELLDDEPTSTSTTTTTSALPPSDGDLVRRREVDYGMPALVIECDLRISTRSVTTERRGKGSQPHHTDVVRTQPTTMLFVSNLQQSPKISTRSMTAKAKPSNK